MAADGTQKYRAMNSFAGSGDLAQAFRRKVTGGGCFATLGRPHRAVEELAGKPGCQGRRPADLGWQADSRRQKPQQQVSARRLTG